MSVFETPEVIRTMQAAMTAEVTAAPALPKGPAIDSKPLAGGEIHIRLALSPGMIVLLAAPLSVLLTSLAAWLLLTTLSQPLYVHEMFAGATVNTLGGILAALPIFWLMKKGAAAIAQAGILSIALRCGAILLGMFAAMAPAWSLDKMPLVYWVMGYYFPLLMVETAVVAWLSNKAKH